MFPIRGGIIWTKQETETPGTGEMIAFVTRTEISEDQTGKVMHTGTTGGLRPGAAQNTILI